METHLNWLYLVKENHLKIFFCLPSACSKLSENFSSQGDEQLTSESECQETEEHNES